MDAVVRRCVMCLCASLLAWLVACSSAVAEGKLAEEDIKAIRELEHPGRDVDSFKAAVVVGINDYQDEQITDLKYAVADAEAFAERLGDQGTFGSIKLLTTTQSDEDKRPTKFNVLRALETVAGNAGPDDMLLLYFSGHGVRDYLLPQDGRLSSPENSGIAMAEINRILEGSQASRQVLILDCCHSGGLRVGGVRDEAVMLEEQEKAFLKDVDGRITLSSCGRSQVAHELPDKGHGVFTYYLLRALKGEAVDEKGFVTAWGAAQYVMREVRAWANESGRQQSPRVEANVSGPIVLAVTGRKSVRPTPVQPGPGPTPPAGLQRPQDAVFWDDFAGPHELRFREQSVGQVPGGPNRKLQGPNSCVVYNAHLPRLQGAVECQVLVLPDYSPGDIVSDASEERYGGYFASLRMLLQRADGQPRLQAVLEDDGGNRHFVSSESIPVNEWVPVRVSWGSRGLCLTVRSRAFEESAARGPVRIGSASRCFGLGKLWTKPADARKVSANNVAVAGLAVYDFQRGGPITQTAAVEPAKLEVESVPPGAKVYVNDKLAGRTPCEVEIPPVAEDAPPVVVRVEKEGFRTEERPGKLLPGQKDRLDVKLDPVSGKLMVTSDPAGADVFVDGRRQRQTPCEVEVSMRGRPQRDVHVKVEREGHRSWETTATVVAGETAEVNAELEPALGRLRVTTDPPGAIVYVNGSNKGRTPCEVDVGSTQRETGAVKVTAERDGYLRYEWENVEVLPGQTVELEGTLERVQIVPTARPARLKVVTQPEGASVSVDGAPRGETPCELEVPTDAAGRKVVRVAVRKEGYEPHEWDGVRLTAGRTNTLQRMLRRIPRPEEMAESHLDHRGPKWKAGLTPGQLGWGKDTDAFPDEFVVNPTDGAEMVWVPSGRFSMGTRERGAEADEQPPHMVEVDGLWAYRHEVTNGQFRRFVEASGHQAEGSWEKFAQRGNDHPVVGVTWNDATAYAQWTQARLPTEAEWEYAARGPRNLRYPWGATWNPGVCCNLERRGEGTPPTLPVGTFPSGRSWNGTLDMAGNVSEFCADYYAEDYYAHSQPRNPRGPNAGSTRVVRGGDWYQGLPSTCRTTNRYAMEPSLPVGFIGFRCVLSAGR